MYYLAAIVGGALVTGAVTWNLRTIMDTPASAPQRATPDEGQFADAVRRAERNDGDAEYEVAFMYSHGYGVAKSEIEARKWLERAATDGNVAAEFELGIALRDGRGGVQDYERAVKWIQRAAESGNGQAQFALGNMYRSGTGVPVNNIKAYVWLNVASARGVYDAAIVRDAVLGRLSPLEVIEAQAEARRLSETLPNPPAAIR